MAKKAEIVKAEIVQEVEQFDPSKFQQAGAAVEGFENMGPEDMAKPRLALCQAQTPQKMKDDPKYIKGLTEGDFFNTITGEVYGPKVKLTPLIFFKYRLRFGNKKEQEPDGLMCQSQDGRTGVGTPGGSCQTCPMQLWTDGQKPKCTQLYGYASLVVPEKETIRFDNLVVVSLKSANMGLAKEWNAMMRLRQGEDRNTLPMWRGIYELSSVARKFDLGTAYMAVPKNAGMHEPKSVNAQICRSSYYMIKELYDAGRLQVDAEDVTREPGE